MKKLLPMLFFLVPAVSFAQGSRVDDIAFKNLVTGIAPANGATVTVCTSAGTGIPCTPLATIYSDIALTVPQTNPITADSNGYYGFYATPGRYVVTVTGAGTSGRSITYTVPCDPSGTGTSSCLTLANNNIFTGNNTFSGQFTATNPCIIAAIYYVEASGCYTTIDLAIAAVPSFSIVAATGCSETTNVVTCTTTAPHGFLVNQTIFVAGVTDNGYNGEFPLSAVGSTTFSYLNCVVPQGGGQSCITGLGVSGGGTASPAAHVVIPANYAGAEVSTCSNLDNAGNAMGGYFSVTPPNIHVEDRRGTSKCAYNIGWNSNGLQSNPNNMSIWRRDTSPNITSSNLVTDLQVTGSLPPNQAIAGGTFEVDTIGTLSNAASAFIQATNGQWAVRSVGADTIEQIMGSSGGGGIDRSYATTNVLQGSGIYAFDPKNVSNVVTPATIANSPTGATETGSTVTITTTATCSFTTGQGVAVAGVTNTGYNGNWIVLAPGCNGTSTFTYSNVNNQGLAASGSGTVNAYRAQMYEAYSLIATLPTVGTRNNSAIFAQGPISFSDNIGGIDVMNQAYSLPTGATAQKLLRFGGDNSQPTAGVNQYSTAFGGVPYKYIVQAGNQSNWMTCSACNNANSLEITPSTAAGGTTFSTPGLRVFNNGAGGASTVAIDSGGLQPRVAGTGDIGATALPFGNLWLGTAATNNFKFQPAATAASRTISILDPGAASTLDLTSNTTTTTSFLLHGSATAGMGTWSAFAPATDCATCTTNAAALTSNAVVLGGGGQASKTVTAFTTNGTTTMTVGVAAGGNGVLALAGNTSGTATFTAPATAGTVTNPVVASNTLQLPGLVASGTAAALTGTGACATFSTQTGGAWAGRATCTAATAASTFIITPGATAPNGWVCYAQDQTTRANLLQQTSTTTTACTLTATSVTQNDVIVFTAFAF